MVILLVVFCHDFDITHKDSNDLGFISTIYSFFVLNVKKNHDVATKEGNEVVILGAWGCGAFKNSIEIVSKTFVELLKNYDFEIVEFALATTNDVSNNAFARALWE